MAEAGSLTLASPRRILHAESTSFSSVLSNNFVRSASWCPDGSCILTESEDRAIRIFDVPRDVDDIEDQLWLPRLALQSADAVTCTAWYPGAQATDPASMCFVKATKDHPIHLVDANTGKVRGSYPIVDHLERFVAPHSVAFSSDASTLYCGYESALEVFTLDRPGEAGERFRTSTSRRSKDGQKGIISTLAIAPSQSGILAAGSFSGSIALYDTTKSQIEPVSVFPAEVDREPPNGVSQIRYHSSLPILFSASRNSSHITAWDLRSTPTPVQQFHRPGKTKQRIAFEVDPWGRWLVTGDQKGKVRVYNAQTLDAEPLALFDLHADAVPVASLHPWKPFLLTCAGSRHFDLPPSAAARRPSLDSDTDPDDEEGAGTNHSWQSKAGGTMSLWHVGHGPDGTTPLWQSLPPADASTASS